MAKKKEEVFSFSESISKLKREGAKKLYLIWGAEDYLSEQYFEELKKLCLTSSADDFSYRRLSERDFSAERLAEAIDSVPFLSERSLVEVRNIDLNKIKEEDGLDSIIKAISDIPEYCTVVFINDATFEPDKRLKLMKTILKHGEEIHTTAQKGPLLLKWIVRRFDAHGKRIDLDAAQRLMTVSGELMNKLIPEIDKLAAYVKGDVITVADVNAVAHHIPEAVVFEMTEKMSAGEYNAASALLAELLADKNSEPIVILAVIGNQMRQLYAARVAIESGKGADFVVKVCKLNPSFGAFIAGKLIASARKLSTAQVKRAVELCAETDYKMKSTGEDTAALLKECVMRIAVGEENAKR